MIKKYFFSFFFLFLKNRRLQLRFQCRNEFCMQKQHSKGIFIGFAENSHFSENFRTGYSMAIFMLSVKKLIYTNLAIFGLFLSKKHNSFGFRKFCLKLVEKIIRNNDYKYCFFSLFCFFSKNVGFGSVFSAEMNSACKNNLLRVFLQDLQKTAIFPRIFEQAIAWRFSCYQPKN